MRSFLEILICGSFGSGLALLIAGRLDVAFCFFAVAAFVAAGNAAYVFFLS